MAVSYLDNVFVTSTTTGTGTLTQSGIVTGYAAPAAGDNGKTFVVMIKAVDANGLPTGEWELCESVYTHSGTTWSRGDLIDSSTGSRVNFAAGAKRVAIVQVARDIGSDSQIVLPEIAITTGTTLTLGRRHVMTGTSANYTCPLPSVSGNTGKKVIVRMSPLLTKLVTLDAGAGVTINGKSTTLSAAISSTSSTSISVASATGFPASGDFVIQIDNELIKVTAGHGTTTWTVVRGIAGTTAETHSNGVSVDLNRTRVMWANEAAELVCDGANWFKVAGQSIPMTCRMKRTTSTGALNNDAYTTISLNVTEYDSGGMADTGNGFINIVRKSQYLCCCVVQVDGSTGSGGMTYFGPSIYKNTSTEIIAVYQKSDHFINTAMSTSSLNFLNVGDAVKLRVYKGGSGAYSLLVSNPNFLEVVEVPSW